MGLGCGFGINLRGDRRSLSLGEPIRVDNPVIEKEEDDGAEEDGRNRLEDEEPLPSGDALAAREVMQDKAR